MNDDDFDPTDEGYGFAPPQQQPPVQLMPAQNGTPFGQPPAPQVAGPAPPPPPDAMEPWDQSSDLRLSKLNSALSHVNEREDSAYLDPNTANDLRGQIQRQRGPLLARKQAWESLAKLKAVHDAHEQAAIQQGVMLQNRQADSESFTGAMATHVDPDTGEKTRFYQRKPGEWDAVPKKDVEAVEGGVDYMPLGGTVMGIGATPDVKPNPDGTHTMTIQNGLHRTEVNFAQDPSSPTGWRTRSVQNFDADGNPVVPGAPVAPPAKSAARLQAEQEMGRPRPPEQVMFNGRLHHNPATVEWDKEVGARTGRIETEVKQYAARDRQRADISYKDALTSHPLKEYSEAADPHAAREAAVMDDFAKQHPDDPLVKDWLARNVNREAALARRDPGTMSLNELATAAYGPHANVKKIMDDAKAEVVKDKRVIPPDTQRGGSVYNPADGAKTGVWQDMDPEGIHEEALRRAKSNLRMIVDDKRKSGGAVGAPAGAAPTPAGANAPAARTTVPASALPPEVAAKIDRIKGAGGGAPGGHKNLPPAPVGKVTLTPEEQQRSDEAYRREVRGHGGIAP